MPTMMCQNAEGVLPPGHYGGPAFSIPAICASGYVVDFYAVGMDGQVAYFAKLYIMSGAISGPCSPALKLLVLLRWRLCLWQSFQPRPGLVSCYNQAWSRLKAVP